MRRLLAAGDLDLTFSGDAVAGNSFRSTLMRGTGADAVIDSAGKIVIVGRSHDGYSRYSPDFAIARQLPSGAPDLAFGHDGQTITDFGGADSSREQANAVAIDSAGRIIAAGRANLGVGSDFALVRYSSGGALDTSFGGDGTVTTDIGAIDDEILDVQLDTLGRIVVAGGSRGRFALARYLATGALDTTFGNNGVVVTDLQGGGGASALLVLPDGRLVAAGSDGTDFALARYTTAGALDATFGVGGKALFDTGPSPENPEFDRLDFAKTVVRDGAGRLIIAGQSHGDFAFVRFLEDGGLDTSFGISGVRTIDTGSINESINKLIIDSAGRLVATGDRADREIVMRLTTSGQLDTNFDQDGWVTPDPGNSIAVGNVVLLRNNKIVTVGTQEAGNHSTVSALVMQFNENGSSDTTFGTQGASAISFIGQGSGRARAVLVQPDGKVIVGGEISITPAQGDNDFGLMRFNADGSVDTTFGHGGQVITGFTAGAKDAIAALALNGTKIVAVGQTAFADIAVTQYNADGSLDPTFGTGGRFVLDINGDSDSALAVLVQPDGKIVVAGEAASPAPETLGDYDVALVRLNANGTLDTSFGSGGKVLTDLRTPRDSAVALGRQSDGKLIVGARDLYQALVVMRYLTSGTLDTSFGQGGIARYGIEGKDDVVTGLVVLPDDSIVLSGASRSISALVKLHSDGTLDQAFGTGGVFYLPDQQLKSTRGGIAPQADGKLLVALQTDTGVAVARVTAAGAFDLSYGIDGVSKFDAVGGLLSAVGIGLTADGRAVVGFDSSLGYHTQFGAVRFQGDLVPPAQGAFRFALNTFTGNEGTTATITVRRTGGSQGTAAVNFAATADTATADADFTATAGTLTFGPGVLERTFTVALRNDTIEEGGERIALSLSGATAGAAIDNPYRAKLIIAGEPTSAGLVDATFGQNGTVTSSTLTESTIFEGKDGAVALQSDGKIVIVTKTEYPGTNWLLERYNPDGTPDFTFGDSGKVVTDFALGSGFDAPHAVAILPDGKIIVAGEASINNPGGSDVWVTSALARYNTDGSLDTSFGNGGRVMGDLQVFPVSALLVAPDGKLVIGGNLSNTANASERSFLRRYNADGTLDESFGHAGTQLTPDSIKDLVLQPDGKIVSVGNTVGTTNGIKMISLGRYRSDGSLDNTFGTAGRVVTDLGPNTDDVPYSAAIQADGKLVIVGEKENTTFVARYTPAGALDPSFNGTGVNTISFPSFFGGEHGRAVAVQEDGKILLAATIGPFGDEAGIARFNADGTLNTSFGTDGTTIFGIADGFEPAQIILQPDGKAVVGGIVAESGVGYHLGLVRFLADPRRGKLQFDVDSYRVDENAGLATITVQRTGGTDGEVTVNFAASSGTAQVNSDFLPTSGTLIFADGEAEKTFTVTLLDNAVAEGNETLQLALSAPGGGAELGSRTTAGLQIYDGPGKIGFSQTQYYAGEDFGQIDITLVRSDGSDGTVTVYFAIANDTATDDFDFMGLNRVVTFGDGETTKEVSITLLNDTVIEGLETARLGISAPTGGATLADLRTATLLIFDQEAGEAHNPGSPDASWGAAGVVETDFSPSPSRLTLDQGRDIAIQPNGRAVVIGATEPLDGASDFAIARYLPDGSLDTSFGGDGRVATDLGGRDEAQKVLLQTDGRIVVVGYTIRNGASDFALARYLPGGTLDASFGSGGVVLTDFAKADDRAYSAAFDSQGRIVVVGSSGDVLHRDFAVARYLVSGVLDTTFSDDGRLTTDFDGRSDIGRDVTIDGDGKIVAIGGTNGFDSQRFKAGDIAIVRYLANGNLDTTFDGDGRVRTNVSAFDNSTRNDDEGRRILVLPDGKLLVGGTSDANFLIGRYLPDGQMDNSFGVAASGFTSLNFDSSSSSAYDQLRDMLIQPDGKIVAVGTGHSQFGVARLNADGIFDPTFGAGGLYVSPQIFSSANAVAYFDSRLYIVSDRYDDFQIGRFTTQPGSPIYGSFNLGSQFITVDENVGTAKIDVTRPFDASYGTVTVNYLVTGSSATAGQDFVPVSGVLTFFEGESNKQILVPIINDSATESDETIQVFLFNATGGAELGSVARGTLTIRNNDPLRPSLFSLGYGNYSVTEDQGSVTIEVSRGTDASGAATVRYATGDGSAKAGEDYGFVQGVLNFNAGETSKQVSVPITDDSAIEGNERFTFTIFAATGSTRIESASREIDVNIIDYEPLVCTNAGALDPTFDGDGKATFDTAGLDPDASAMLEQPDGKLVIAGSAWDNAAQKYVTVVTRLNASGALDTTFGTGGSVTLAARVDSDRAAKIFWQSGKLLIAGTSSGQQVEGVKLIRLNSNGSLDTTFGTGGIAAYDLTHPFDSMQAFAMQSDGKVVAAGYVENGEDADRAVLRFNANGTLDATFGNGGQFYYDSSDFDSGVTSIVIAPGGQILVSSSSNLMRLSANGTLDTTFGQVGFLRTDLIDGDFDAMLYQPDGKLLLAKQDYLPDLDFALVVSVIRLNSDFTPDATFGIDGRTAANFQTYVQPAQLALESDGRILVAGGDRDFSIARFYPDGGLDIGFGADGIVLTDFAGSDSADSLLVRTDGKIVVGGTKNACFAIARYVGGQSIGAFRTGSATYNVQENGGSISVPVLRVCGMDQAVSVHYATANGTAVSGTDYDARSGVLSWGNRQSATQIITIPIKDDQVFRGTRAFTLALSQPGGGAALQSPGTATITIADDEAPGRLGLHSPIFHVNEADGTARIQIDRMGGSGGPVSVTLAATSGTAVAGSDYQFASQVVNFANNETTKIVAIPIIDDALLEDAESLTITLSNPQGGATLTDMLTAAEVEITDDEVPQFGTLEFAATSVTRSEDGESAVLVVRRTGGASGAVQATIAISGGSATNGLDFASDERIVLSFAPGQESVSVPIAIIDDLTVESTESVTFVLSDSGAATLGDKVSSTIVILDNDYVANNVQSWQNARNPFDVNDDGFVSPIDALLVINEINLYGARKLPAPGIGQIPPPYFDVSRDGYVAPLDVLLVINYINVHLYDRPAEGESAARAAAVDVCIADLCKDTPPPLEAFFKRRRA